MTDDLGFPTRSKIGTTQFNMQDLKVEPVVTFMHNTERTVGGGSKRTSLECLWEFPDRMLEGDQYYQLKNIMGDSASTPVIIDVVTDEVDAVNYEPIVATYQAIMHWPDPDTVNLVAKNRWEITDGIKFTGLRTL